MKYYFHLFVNFLLLITTPALLATPQIEAPKYIPSDFPEYTNKSQVGKVREQLLSKATSFTYDDLLEFIDEVENGDTESYTPKEFEKMLDAIIALARAGVDEAHPSNENELEHDIETLMTDFPSYAFSNAFGDGSFVIIPAVFHGQFHVTKCN